MSPGGQTSEPGPATVRVWDPLVRLFHWSLVAGFTTAYVTADEIQRIHELAGYTIAGLLVLRILWGFVGTPHARFSDFVRPPGEVASFLLDSLRLKARRFIGHNPAGGAMVLALIATLAGACVTGYMMTTDAFWGIGWVEDLHEVLANGTLALVFLHLAGVLLASFEHRENLVRAMVTGRKRAGGT
ncbi:cytochrome b/b6 domain-containing protein [Stappia sp. MMSF_3263]|uniref:cytochrome b/b6 domain-containing protein n=1 Tax=Stappia sp. MMSF_3263 TaxID=3046693 RepID=UPI00273D5D4F|nr:cytochrome b/b6 domain-containing protein [Stappia sp. MMSF_3263]